jgi:uncharacterized membrane protein
VSLPAAAALGFAAGLRTFTPLAALHLRGRIGGPRLLVVAAAGELVVDKLPMTPSRLDPPALAGRVASGAGSGRVVAGWPGAAMGAAAAVAGSYAGARVREARPGFATAVAEDAVAVTLAGVAAS